MTELQKRMIECLQLRGLSERTQEAYVQAIRQLSEHYHKSPALITEAELRHYFLFLMNVQHYSRPTMTIAICGIKFFFERTLEKGWTIFNLVRPAPEKKLPVILSRAEVLQILSLIRLPRYRVRLSTIYSCGLRLQERTNQEWLGHSSPATTVRNVLSRGDKSIAPQLRGSEIFIEHGTNQYRQLRRSDIAHAAPTELVGFSDRPL